MSSQPDAASFGAGDSMLYLDILSPNIAVESFYKLRDEIEWNDMSHKGGSVPRLIAIQGQISDKGIWPLYRHPADEQPILLPWHPIVRTLKDVAERLVEQTFNHVLIQYYRNSLDYISPHSDKTLDILKGTKIVNVSLGACRTMQLKSKDDADVGKPAQKIALAHNSLFVLGWESNKLFLHGIKQDKRDISLKRPDEIAFNGERISLTFRTVATFVHPRGFIFGQGAKTKSERIELKDSNSVICRASEQSMQSQLIFVESTTDNVMLPTKAQDEDEEEEALRLIKAFSAENKRPDFDWDEHYGRGFSVINVATTNRAVPRIPPAAVMKTEPKSMGVVVETSAAVSIDHLEAVRSCLHYISCGVLLMLLLLLLPFGCWYRGTIDAAVVTAAVTVTTTAAAAVAAALAVVSICQQSGFPAYMMGWADH